MPAPSSLLPRVLLRTAAVRPAITSCPRIATARAVDRTFSVSAAARRSNNNEAATANAPPAPAADKASTETAYLGTKKRLPEFSLKDKVVLVSGGARGLGLTQAEALLEAGATGEFIFYSLSLHSTRTRIPVGDGRVARLGSRPTTRPREEQQTRKGEARSDG